MSWEAYYLLGVIIIAIYLFITEKASIDIIALMVTILLMIAGIITVDQGLSGFSNQAALSILALLILSAGLERTGAIKRAVEVIGSYTGNKVWTILILILPFCAILSAFINNTAVIAIFLPVLLQISEDKGISASKLLLPMAIVSILGGLCTIIGTSTNLLVNGVAREMGIEPLGFFEFTQIGIVLAIIGIIYMLVIGHRLIPERRKPETVERAFNLQNYLANIRIPMESKYVRNFKSLREDLNNIRLNIIRIISNKGNVYFNMKINRLLGEDEVLVQGKLDDILKLYRNDDVRFAGRPNLQELKLNTSFNQIFEVVVSPNSYLIGKNMRDIDFYDRYGTVPLALRRSEKETATPQRKERILRVGDTLVLESENDLSESSAAQDDFIIITPVQHKGNVRKQIISTLIIIAVVVTAAIGLIPLVVSAFAGVALMVFTGCLNTHDAYRNIDWQIYFLIAGFVPISYAMSNTGLDHVIANSFLYMTSDMGGFFMILSLFFITVFFTNLMANNATGLLMTPIAIVIAENADMPYHAMLLAVMLGASMAFFTPFGYHTMTLIYAPGKYKFMDYVKVGLPVTIICGVIASWLIYLMYL